MRFWDPETGQMGEQWSHIYTDQVLTVAGYNQMLIDWYQGLTPVGPTEPARMNKFVVNAQLMQIEHNEGWEY